MTLSLNKIWNCFRTDGAANELEQNNFKENVRAVKSPWSPEEPSSIEKKAQPVLSHTNVGAWNAVYKKNNDQEPKPDNRLNMNVQARKKIYEELAEREKA